MNDLGYDRVVQDVATCIGCIDDLVAAYRNPPVGDSIDFETLLVSAEHLSQYLRGEASQPKWLVYQ